MYLVFVNKNDVINDMIAFWKGKYKELLIGILKVEKYEGMGCNKDVYFLVDFFKGVEVFIDFLF